MALKKAICPFCDKQIMVNSDSPRSICAMCRKDFPTEEAMDKYIAAIMAEEEENGDFFPFTYRITIEREHDAFISNRITVILMINGHPQPLADGACISFASNAKLIEIPVYITDNEHTTFEGVFLGTSVGRDIRFVWSAEFYGKSLGRIKESSNPTIILHEKPGAARW